MIVKTLVLGIGVATLWGFTTPPAKADDNGGSCGGTLIEYVPVNVDGQKVGQLQLYYNASNGNNCAVMLHGGPTWGVSKDTGVLLAKGDTKNGAYTQAGYERAQFSYQAGPIRTPGRGKCVYAGGGIDYAGSHHTVYTGQHCG